MSSCPFIQTCSSGCLCFRKEMSNVNRENSRFSWHVLNKINSRNTVEVSKGVKIKVQSSRWTNTRGHLSSWERWRATRLSESQNSPWCWETSGTAQWKEDAKSTGRGSIYSRNIKYSNPILLTGQRTLLQIANTAAPRQTILGSSFQVRWLSTMLAKL